MKVKKYAAIVMYDPNLSESQIISEYQKKFLGFIEKYKGTLESMKFCGKIQTAYSIKKCSSANYVIYFFDMIQYEDLGVNLKHVKQNMENDSMVLRFLNYSIDHPSLPELLKALDKTEDNV